MDSGRDSQRQIRVFVSSTFRDMQGERDDLVKRVFPALRKRCEERGVAFTEVDLRWGVTDEQKAEGQVLPICLAEIERCKPYFLGLLGERYGWIPGSLAPDLLESEPWLERYLDRSVTELEIIHGVLDDPEMATHVYFYFRDPAYNAQLPDYAAESPAHAARLADLKDRIRQSGLAVMEDYAEPRALGDRVLADLEELIERLFPVDESPDPHAAEDAVHEAFATSRSGVYIDRPDLFELLDGFAAGDGPPLAVLGASGTGKSALLANWARRLDATAGAPPAIAHFAGASAQSADWTQLCRRLIYRLARRFDFPAHLPDDPAALRAAFADALFQAASRGRYVLVLDGLEQLEDRDGAPDLVWLPVSLPPEARVVASVLPGRALDELGKRRWVSLTVEPLGPVERARLIEAYLARFGKALPASQRETLSGAGQAENALFLRMALEELRQHGRHETLPERLATLLAARDVPDLFQQVLGRWEADFETDRPHLVRDALAAVWAARRGLAEAELLDILGSAAGRLAQAAWSPFLLAADEALVNRAGLLGFAHDYMRQAVEARYLPSEADRNAAHRRLADYFGARALGGRTLEELPWQLVGAGEYGRLAEILADPAWLEALCAEREHEVKRCWARIEAESDLRLPDILGASAAACEDPEHTWRIATLLADLGYPTEALELRERLVDLYRAAGEPAALQATLGNLALSLMAAGRLDEADSLFVEQEALCREHSLATGLQAALGYRAILARARGDMNGALGLLVEQEELCRATGHLEGLQSCLGNSALVVHELGDPRRALELLSDQEQLCRQLDNLPGLQAALGNMALVLRALGDLTGALELHAEEERICRDLGNRQALQACLGNQGIARRQLGDAAGALALHADEERICRQLGYREGLKASLGNQALVQQMLGNPERALALHVEEEALCRELDSQLGLQASLGNQSLVYLELGDLDRARTLASEQARLCAEHGFREGLSCALDNLGQVHAAAGQPDLALARYAEAEELARAIGSQDGVAESFANQARVHLALGRPDLALALAEQAEEICRVARFAEGLAKALWGQGLALVALGRESEARFALEEAAALAAKHHLVPTGRRIDEALGALP